MNCCNDVEISILSLQSLIKFLHILKLKSFIFGGYFLCLQHCLEFFKFSSWGEKWVVNSIFFSQYDKGSIISRKHLVSLSSYKILVPVQVSLRIALMEHYAENPGGVKSDTIQQGLFKTLPYLFTSFKRVLQTDFRCQKRIFKVANFCVNPLRIKLSIMQYNSQDMQDC